MRIGQRMYLALLPAALGVFTVAGLAYWGRYAHAAPEWLVVAAVITTLISFAVAWRNLRYVTARVERLAAHGSSTLGAAAVGAATPDELEAIETRVHHLSSAADAAETARRAGQDALRDQQHAYAELLGRATNEAMRRLDDIRLPLHILLENHFGDLNENQEEMLGTARAAAEQAGNAFQRLGEIAEIDRGAVVMRRDRIRPGDLIAGVVPALVAEGQQRGVRVLAEVAPALQSIVGDRGRLQLALELLLHDGLRRTASGAEMRVTAEAVNHRVAITATHGSGTADPIALALGRRLIAAQGGTTVERGDGETRVTEIALA
jgi:signal transduction histidine kinase